MNKLLALRNPRLWGEGASSRASDGSRFESWKQNPMTEWRSRYKGYGVMLYRHVETNAVSIHSQTKSFSTSEIAAMIEGLVRHDTKMRVEKNFVDSHGQSEVARSAVQRSCRGKEPGDLSSIWLGQMFLVMRRDDALIPDPMEPSCRVISHLPLCYPPNSYHRCEFCRGLTTS